MRLTLTNIQNVLVSLASTFISLSVVRIIYDLWVNVSHEALAYVSLIILTTFLIAINYFIGVFNVWMWTRGK
jgi:hypothetical protein